MPMKIVNTHNLPTVDYRKLTPLQGKLKDLSKDNHDKLLKSIEDEGFFLPVFTWTGDKQYLLDGHQRLRVLKKNKLTPYEIPYIDILAKDTQEAGRKLLKISSQYGTITQEGLDEFIAKFELPEVIFEDIHFDALRFGDEKQGDNNSNDNEEVEYSCPECGHVNTPSAFKTPKP